MRERWRTVSDDAAVKEQRAPGAGAVHSQRWSGKLLALDVGQARIGIAVCDPLQLAARPLLTLERRSRERDLARIAELAVQQEASAVICGLPLNMDGSQGPQAANVRRWAQRLAHALRKLRTWPIPVVFADERLSTFAAQELLAGASVPAGEDAVAAAVILQAFLDAQRRGDALDLGVIVLAAQAVHVDTGAMP